MKLKGRCDQPEPVKGYIDGRAKEHTLGCFSSSRLYNQEVKRAEKQASAS